MKKEINYHNINQQLKEKEISHIVKWNEPLMNYTSLRIGGPADIFSFPNHIEELVTIISVCQANQIPYYVIGNGTNLLVLDQGIRGMVIKLGEGFKKIDLHQEKIHTGAGVSIQYLSTLAAKEGLSGLEFAINIPGTVGGCILNNSSFNGNCMADIIESVTFLNKEKRIERELLSELCFKYRECNLKNQGVIILDATLLLKKGDKDSIHTLMGKFIKIRKDRQPVNQLSAGSIFKNPEGYFAGELIEKVGLKGLARGKAMVSDKHANFIINTGGAKATDILWLIEEIQKKVEEKFNLKLEKEIEVLGE